MPERIRVLIADDHFVTRKGIASLLRSRDDVDVVAEVEDGREAVEQVRTLQPHVVILDLMMPNMSGIEATQIIHKEFPGVGILILTGYENEQQLYRIIEAGASGYVLKTAGIEELSAAIDAVAQGKRYFSSSLHGMMVNGYLRRAEQAHKRQEVSATLTKREQEILKLVAEGYTNQMISERLFISPRTVDTHRTNLMKKLNIHDVVSLVRYAAEHGIVEIQKGSEQ